MTALTLLFASLNFFQICQKLKGEYEIISLTRLSRIVLIKGHFSKLLGWIVIALVTFVK